MSRQRCLPPAFFRLELTRFGGHLHTWDRESRMKEVNRADEIHEALPARVPHRGGPARP